MLNEVLEDLRLTLSPSFPVGLQILNEVLAFWEFSSQFARFCKVYIYMHIYIQMVHDVQMPGMEFWTLLGSGKHG